ncbi:carbohydrate kinase family protein [Patescibacteria group bacterium]|nr:carbohydrate kinase family protein [Patescibacteria group bacterium]
MNNKICVIGGATWDVFFTTPQASLGRCNNDDYLMFPYGGKIDALDVKYGFGGGAANVAISLSRLGLSVSLLSRLGKDWRGKEVVKNLNYHQVKTNLIQYDSQQVTPLSFIATSGGSRDHVAFVDRGAAKHLKMPAKLAKDFDWFYVTSLANKAWPVFLTKLFTTAVKQGQKNFWNPGARQLADKKSLIKLLPLVDILDVNKEEAETLTNLNNVAVPVLLVKLKALGSKAVLITDGSNGAYYFDGQSLVHQPSFKVKPVNTTGAGDSFGSAWLAGYTYSKGNVKQAMLWGMRNASSVIKTVGAQNGLLSLKQIKK